MVAESSKPTPVMPPELVRGLLPIVEWMREHEVPAAYIGIDDHFSVSMAIDGLSCHRAMHKAWCALESGMRGEDVKSTRQEFTLPAKDEGRGPSNG